ncbi:MAG: hypothetical protein Q9222_004414 [Ikaeria aurantiellina]
MYSPVLLSSLLFSYLPLSYAADGWFPGPFSTDGRWMLNAKGDNLTYAGVNWPGAAEIMIPEGLQYASIPSLVEKIKDIGMNAIRLTWAVEMVDDILDNGGDVTLRTSFTKVLGDKNGTSLYNAVLRNNPSFAPNITRLQVFDAVAQECAKQQVYVHLDNHVSKAGWCCDHDDGNAWFGDTYFDVRRWKRALGYMAEHGRSWPSLLSMGLRNELRRPSDWHLLLDYNWASWYGNMTAGADAVHKANPDVLIFFSGLEYDSQLRPVFTGAPLGHGPSFNKSKLDYANKVVLEVHDYDFGSNCTEKEGKLMRSSCGAIDSSDPDVKMVFPLVMSEWGFAQQPDQNKAPYASCLQQFLPAQKVGWMTWVLAGSYYIRSGQVDYDESWGLLDHEWKDWRCPECITEGLAPMIKATLPNSGGQRATA